MVSETTMIVERRKKGEEMRKVMIEKGYLREPAEPVTEL
jgi:hypothetical protein